jgi:hypothetical protein
MASYSEQAGISIDERMVCTPGGGTKQWHNEIDIMASTRRPTNIG